MKPHGRTFPPGGGVFARTSSQSAVRMRFFALMIMLLALPAPSLGQSGTAGVAFVQGSVAVVPGVGAQVGYVGARSFFTVEGLFYVGGSPVLGRGERTFKFSLGLGGALRPLGVLRTIGGATHSYDIDLGLRFGPSLLFSTRPTRATKNQQFSLFLDPFLRVTRRLRSGRILFAELGPLRPAIRVGAWFTL